MKYLLPLTVFASAFALGGCAIGPEVHADYDRATDFTKYKTFGFASPLGTDKAGHKSIVSQHLKAATQRELEARGVRFVTSAPQLLVNFNASLDEKTSVTTISTPTSPIPPLGYGLNNGYYDYRIGLYSAWPLYRDETIVTNYKEGTLNIDIVDAARKQLVWEGVVTDSNVTQKELDNVQLAVDKSVAAAFSKFPVAAPIKAPSLAK